MAGFSEKIASLFGIAPHGAGTELSKVGDRRGAPRFEIALDMQWPEGSGLVRDISATGVRFETSQPVSPDDKMKFTIVIPDEDNEQHRQYALCDSEIRWTAPSLTQLGKLIVGAKITNFKFVTVPLAA